MSEHPQACHPGSNLTRRRSENGPHSRSARLLIQWPTTVHKLNRIKHPRASTSSPRPPLKWLDVQYVQSSSDITSRPRPYHGSFEGKAQFFTTPSPRSWILAREPSHKAFAGSGDHLLKSSGRIHTYRRLSRPRTVWLPVKRCIDKWTSRCNKNE